MARSTRPPPRRQRRKAKRREPIGGAGRQFGPTGAAAPIRDVLTPERGGRQLGPVPPAISNLGIGNMQEFNRRLDAIVRAHRSVHGVDPSPGFAWDLLSEDRDERGYVRLLRAGVSAIRNRVPKELAGRDFGPRSGGIPRESPFLEDVDVPEGLAERAFGPTLAPPLSGTDPLAALARGQSPEMETLRASVYSGPASDLFWRQVRDGITGIPGGIAYLATAVGLDIRDLGTHAYRATIGHIPLAPEVRARPIQGRTLDVGEEIAKATWDMIRNPTAYPGDWFLMGAGLVVPGAGAVSRITTATRLVASGASKGAIAKALVFRPNPGTFTLGVGQYQAIIPLSRNIVYRELVQRQRLEHKQAQLSRRWGPDGEGPPQYGDLRRRVQWFFSPERTLERNYMKQRSMALQLRLAPLDDLDHHIQWNASKDSIVNDLLLDHRFARWLKSAKNRTGIEKAIEILATADDDPLRAHRTFHERMIQKNVGLAAAHRAQLAALDAAEELLANPDRPIGRGPTTFRDLYESVRRASERREELLGVYFGADERMLRRRVASHAAVLRGEFDSTRTGGLIPGSKERGRLDRVRSRIDVIEQSLNRALEAREGEFLRRFDAASAQLAQARSRRRREAVVGTEFDYRPDTPPPPSEAQPALPAPKRRPMTYEEAVARVDDLEGEIAPFLEVLYQDAANEFGVGQTKLPSGHVIRSLPQIEATFANRRSAKKRRRDTTRPTNERVAARAAQKLQQIRDGSWRDPQLQWLQSIIREADDLHEAIWRHEMRETDLRQGIFDPEDIPEALPFPEIEAEPGLGVAIRPPRVERHPLELRLLDEADLEQLTENARAALRQRDVAADPELVRVTLGRIRTLTRRIRSMEKRGLREERGITVRQLAGELERERQALARMGVREVKTAAELLEEQAERKLRRLEEGKDLRWQRRVEGLQRKLGRLYAEEDDLLDLLSRADALADVRIDPLTRASYARGFRPFYIPSQRVPNFRRQFGGLRRTVAGYGLRAVESFDELEHEFTGNSIRIGDTRFDASTLTVRSYAKAAKAVERVHQAKGLWEIGVTFKDKATPTLRHMVPIRSTERVPDRLKAMLADIDDGTLRGSVWDKVEEGQMEALRKYLHPAVEEIDVEELPNVRWVDPRFVVWKPNDWKKTTDAIFKGLFYVPNEFFRLTNLFLRPAYALNALGAAGLTVIQEGFLAPVYLGRALLAKHKWGEDGLRQLMKLGGDTRTASFMTEGGHSLSSLLYRFWEPITDRYFRVSSVLYEMRKLGIKDEDMRRHLGLEGELTEAERLKVTEAGARARRAMIDFELMPFEAAVLRHIFFVYAYMSRSAVWAVHTMIDHPTATAALVALGKENDEQLDEILGKARPGYIDQMGGLVFAGRDDQGRPLLENWSQLGNFSSLADLTRVGLGLFTDVKYQAIEDFYNGGPEFFSRLASGKDEYGRDFDRGNLIAALEGLWGESSIGRAVNLLREGDPDTTLSGQPGEVDPFVMSLRDAISSAGTNPILARESAAGERPVLSDEGWMKIVGPLVYGGSRSRAYDAEAAAARYWRDQPVLERLKHEMDTIMGYLQVQARALGRTPSDELKAALRTVFRINNAKANLREANPTWDGGVPARSEIRIWLAAARAEGIISAEQERQFQTKAKRAARSPEEIKAVLAQVKVLVAAPITEWDEDIRRVADAQDAGRIGAAVEVLAALGQNVDRRAGKAPEETRLKYARVVLDYLKQEDANDHSDLTDAEFREYQARHDRPVTIDGYTFPSPQRLEWASRSAEQRARDLANWANGEWYEVSALEKELLGRKVDAKVQAGWTAIQRAYDDYKAQHGPYSRVSKEMIRDLARQLDRDERYRGIYEDVLFSQRSPLRRFEALNVYRRSNHKRQWDEILNAARQAERALESGDYTKTYVREKWAEYVEEQVMPWARTQAGFWQEVDGMGETFLKGMIG